MSQIKVKRGDEIRYFDTKVWNLMPANHYGWKPISEVPAEVKSLHEKKSSSEKESPVSDSTDTNKVKKTYDHNVPDTVNLIRKAKTAAAIDQILVGEERKSVITAAEAAKEKLASK